ncbi:MAG: hypothetical protein JSS27_07200 [Planctomycetes bacterium]|nr:hypothetical protein [Planctomycetota bacterium]
MNLLAFQNDPAAFRAALLIDADDGPVRLGNALDAWQSRDFLALDPAWRRVVGHDVSPPCLRAWLERPRGHSKTSDLATMISWALFASRRRLAGVCAAGDQDQARLLRDAVAKLTALNPWLGELLDVQRDRIVNRRTGSELAILTSDAPTSYGLTPDFIICDELTHWANRDLWDSLFSSAAKRASCLLLVITNAGWVDSWQFETREAVRTDPRWHFHRLDGPQASWITADRLAEQERLLPAKAYRRLWLNHWSDGAGDALDDGDVRAALTLSGPPNGPQRGFAYVAGLDLGLARDASALVVLGKHVGWTERQPRPKRTIRNRVLQALDDLDDTPSAVLPELDAHYHEGTGRLQLAAVRIWRPMPGHRVQLEDVEAELLRLHKQFRLVTLAADPWQAEFLLQRLHKANLPTEPIPFSGSNLMAMARATLDAFREHQIDLFRQSDLLADLKALRVVERNYGFRLDCGTRSSESEGAGTRHADAATAFALASLAASRVRGANTTTNHGPLVWCP